MWLFDNVGVIIRAQAMKAHSKDPNCFPRIKFFLKRSAESEQVIVSIGEMVVKGMSPEPLHNFWGYLPQAKWTSEPFVRRINDIIRYIEENPQYEPGESSYITIEGERVAKRYASTFVGWLNASKLGLFELPDDAASLTFDGTSIIEMIIQSTQVKLLLY